MRCSRGTAGVAACARSSTPAARSSSSHTGTTCSRRAGVPACGAWSNSCPGSRRRSAGRGKRTRNSPTAPTRPGRHMAVSGRQLGRGPAQAGDHRPGATAGPCRRLAERARDEPRLGLLPGLRQVAQHVRPLRPLSHRDAPADPGNRNRPAVTGEGNLFDGVWVRGFPDPTMGRTHPLGAETGRKNACRIMQARDNQEERPATVARQRLYRKSRIVLSARRKKGR